MLGFEAVKDLTGLHEVPRNGVEGRDLSGFLSLIQVSYFTNLFVDFLFPRLYHVYGFYFGCRTQLQMARRPLMLRSNGAVGFKQGPS